MAGRDRTLVVLDNFEHVARIALPLVARWLDVASEARFLVTTREVLGLPGEIVAVIDSLPTAEGTALFTSRARSASVGFELTGGDDQRVQRLVEVLDGLPLAIELAASRTRVFSLSTLLERVNDRFTLLSSRTGRISRQATLRATLDWSWDLLLESEKSALAQLSVFRGGFALAAAEDVLDLGSDGALWKADVVQALVEKSLVRVQPKGRFDLLVSVREYAGERLLASDQSPSRVPAGKSVHARHLRHFAGLDERQATASACADLENLVAACHRAAEAGDMEAGARVLVNVWAGLRMTGPFTVGVELARSLLKGSGHTSFTLASTHWVEASALYGLGDVRAASTGFDRALEFACADSGRRAEARVRWSIGEMNSFGLDTDRADADLGRSLELAKALGDFDLEMKVLASRGVLLAREGLPDEARDAYTSALRIARSLGDTRRQGGLLGNLGILLYDEGKFDEARSYYEEALELVERARDRQWEGNTRCNLGLLLYECDELEDACREFDKALCTAREIGDAWLESVASCNLGLVREAQGSLEGAMALHTRALDIALSLGDTELEASVRAYVAWLAVLTRSEEAAELLAIAVRTDARVSNKSAATVLLCAQACAALMNGVQGQARDAIERAESHGSGARIHSDVGRALRKVRELLSAC